MNGLLDVVQKQNAICDELNATLKKVCDMIRIDGAKEPPVNPEPSPQCFVEEEAVLMRKLDTALLLSRRIVDLFVGETPTNCEARY